MANKYQNIQKLFLILLPDPHRYIRYYITGENFKKGTIVIIKSSYRKLYSVVSVDLTTKFLYRRN